jgi:hypothetical protein
VERVIFNALAKNAALPPNYRAFGDCFAIGPSSSGVRESDVGAASDAAWE